MNTDQDNKRVSEAYRDIAREATPADLDARILAGAARSARSRYGIARGWVRPVAWAATIGLSLAFMLELTWFADAPVNVPAPGSAVPGERTRQDAEVMKAKQKDMVNQAIADRANAPVVIEATALTGEPAGPPAQTDDAMAEPAAEAAPLARAADTQTRRQAEPDQMNAVAINADSLDTEQFCDDAARTSAEDWYRCIRELREQGLDDAAAAELEALLRTFPGFREPPAK